MIYARVSLNETKNKKTATYRIMIIRIGKMGYKTRAGGLNGEQISVVVVYARVSARLCIVAATT